MSKLTPLFVYGSLMSPEVLSTLLGRVPQMRSAMLSGFLRLKVKGKRYPAIVEDAKSSTDGLFFHVDDAESKLLDAYEDVEYEKRLLKIKTTDDDASHEAFAYVWPLKNKHLLEGAWSYEQFRSDHLPDYLKWCGEWVSQEYKPQS